MFGNTKSAGTGFGSSTTAGFTLGMPLRDAHTQRPPMRSESVQDDIEPSADLLTTGIRFGLPTMPVASFATALPRAQTQRPPMRDQFVQVDIKSPADLISLKECGMKIITIVGFAYLHACTFELNSVDNGIRITIFILGLLTGVYYRDFLVDWIEGQYTLIADLLSQEKQTSISDDVGTVIGIDLGTTDSCVSVYENGQLKIIFNEEGNLITPSYVAFTTDGERLVGDAAKNQLTTNPENTVYGTKRLIGRAWFDPIIQQNIKSFPFKVIEKDRKPHIKVSTKTGDKIFAPEEISAMVLGKMKEIAENHLNEKVTHAVVTVPAYFNDAQRQATIDAATISGLNVMKIINEPSAAAVAYGFGKKDGEKHILVFDLGGGTFDVSLLRINNGKFRVLATNGDTNLGGEDFDQRIVDHFIKLYKTKKDKDVTKDKRAVQKLRGEVEKAKRTLSISHQVKIEIKSFFDGHNFSEILTRTKFEELNIDLFHRTMNAVQKVLEDVDMNREEVDEIVLVGGSTRIPKVQQLIKEFFDGKEPFRGINADKAVVYGAAVQAGVLSGKENIDACVILDVKPLSLGTDIFGGRMATLIPRNTEIPTKKSEIRTTVFDDQCAITMSVYEGDRAMAKDNHLLGNFQLTGIPPAPRGNAKIEVTFEIDDNGILHVSAEDKSTGKREKLAITKDQYTLTPEDRDRMINDAEKFAEEDKKLIELAEMRCKLVDYVYSLRDKLAHKEKLKSKISTANKTEIQEKIYEKINWLRKNGGDLDPAECKNLKKELADIEKLII